MIAQEENSLGLKLVNAGYDLWMGNSRGNRYSREHQEIDVDTCKTKKVNKYWNFSFQEMAQYDLPAMFEYVQNITGAKKVTYIGHSQGSL